MLLWFGFLLLISILLAFDLGVFNKDAHIVSVKEAFRWTGIWVTLSLLFSIVVYFAYENDWQHIAENSAYTGREAVVMYLTGYLVEQSLSVDNIFVIAVIFTYFKVPQKLQHRVLFWGILGAVIFRGLMILVGAALIANFSWINYIFGGFLLITAYRMLVSKDHEESEIENNATIGLIKRFVPVTHTFHGDHFFVKQGKLTAATPLFVALMVIETTDVLFAFDSIPAIFAITTDPFLVFTSNIFAILGLRSLYFVLASVLDKFQYLKYSLVVILAFVGIKLVLVHLVHLPSWLSLVVIVLSLIGGVLPSLPELLQQRKVARKVKKTAKSEV
jgi:tellurite resistance protein TerC